MNGEHYEKVLEYTAPPRKGAVAERLRGLTPTKAYFQRMFCRCETPPALRATSPTRRRSSSCRHPILRPGALAGIAICLLAVIAVVLFCVGIALFCVVISAVAVAASGILTLFGGIVLLFRSLGDGLCNIGLGLFSTGLGILFVYGAILLFKWLIRKASVSLGKITKGGRRNEKNN